MFTRTPKGDAFSLLPRSIIALSTAFFLTSPVHAQEKSPNDEAAPLPVLEQQLAAVRKTTGDLKNLPKSDAQPVEVASSEGYGPFIRLNPGEELLAEIHFDSGSTTPTYIGERKIEHVIRDLESLNPKQLRIVGFTDRTGSKAVNKAIAEARAEGVANLLQKHGLKIPVVIDPRGEDNILYPTPDGEAEPLNRCVGIIASR